MVLRLLFLLLTVCFLASPGLVRAATLGQLLGSAGNLLTERVPPTCDENFWNTLTYRAWQQGQRETTQNGNLLAKPDSVLSYSCFDHHLNHLAWYADGNYPGDPNETFDNSFLGLGDILWDAARIVFDAPCGVDPMAKNVITLGGPSINMQCALEILILDTMVNNVSPGQPLGTFSIGSIDDLAAPICGRDYYIEFSTYHHQPLGGRAPYPANYMPDNDVNLSSYNCSRMAQVWDSARCYNAIAEPTHDGYYTFGQYTAAGGDYRVHTQVCSASPSFWNSSNYGGMACALYFHGIPAIPFALYWPWSGTPPLTWATATAGANPIPGAPGGVDPYNSVYNLYQPATCNTQSPIRTGVVVTLVNGTTYDDAYCIAPGCWYNPAVSTTQCQPY